LISNAYNNVSYGALRLIDPALPPPCPLTEIEPLDADFSGYVEQWRAHVAKHLSGEA
jgi:hypothetical protein